MPISCQDGRCDSPRWMKGVLRIAGCYQLLVCLGAIGFPKLAVFWPQMKTEQSHLWQAALAGLAALGIGLMIAARSPFRHSWILLLAFLKFSILAPALGFWMARGLIEGPLIWLIFSGEVLGCAGFAVILWLCMKFHVGIPISRTESYTVAEASKVYRLSTGQTLAEASESRLLVLVFLRHFGCTFTRRILRGLEEIETAARERGAELVLVHMLQSGKEAEYLGSDKGVARIADPRCELYRAFGLGKGGFLELFGPLVWLRGTASIIQGCGVGHLAGDGLQMPGAFLFQDGKIRSAQPARSAADLPDIPELFKQLPETTMREKVLA